jgi:NAD(P)-dependent dehydrogenase (short-subunit alcohol dehydrogenase family)
MVMSELKTSNFSIDLSGQVALVTGATSGLGAHFAALLAECGAKVVLTGRRVDRLEELAAQIRESGGECVPITLDMTDRESIHSAIDQAEYALGTVTILINNAGISDGYNTVEMEDQLVDAMFDTNLRGPWDITREVARRLINQKLPGRIVNIASAGAYLYRGNGVDSALYSVTKAAIVRLTETLAVEWSRFHINVNAIAPGLFSSEMANELINRVGEIWKNFPRERLCVPEQLDSSLLFLVSPSSECVTGTCIKVDDGQMPR